MKINARWAANCKGSKAAMAFVGGKRTLIKIDGHCRNH